MTGSHADPRLAALKAQQEAWMRERRLEQDRRSVTEELQQHHVKETRKGPASAACNAPQSVRPEEVIDRLTERLADRIRVELRSELQKENTSALERQASLHQKLEGWYTPPLCGQSGSDTCRLISYLASEIESHTCPICYELMVAPTHSPTLLFPCGHTFCAQCLNSHKGASCPYCRQKITSKALNVSLQQLIQSFVAKKSSAIRGPVGPPEVKAESRGVVEEIEGGVEEGRFAREHRRVETRCRILRNELGDLEGEKVKNDRHLQAADLVLRHLKDDEEEVLERLRKVEAELALVRGQVAAQEVKRAQAEKGAREAEAKIELIRCTLEPLEKDCEKLALLLRSTVEKNDVSPS